METYITGTAPATTWHYKGTLAEIQAVPGPEGSLGHPVDSRLELRYRGGQWEALENGEVDLATGAETAPAQQSSMVRGQKILANGLLFRLAQAATFTRIAAETDCYTAPSGPTALDGGYTLHKAYGGQPPIIRGGFLIPEGQEASQKLVISVPQGISFVGDNLAQSSIAQKCTISGYLKQVSNPATSVKIFEIDAYAGFCAVLPPATFVPFDITVELSPVDRISGNTWSIRTHYHAKIGQGNYNSPQIGPKEQATPGYPQVDLGVDNFLMITQKGDSGFQLFTLVSNQVEVKVG